MPFPLIGGILGGSGGIGAIGGIGGIISGGGIGNVGDMIGGIVGGIGGSNLKHDRFYKIWYAHGYDIQAPGLKKWLFGKRGNNVKRAGYLTADMIIGVPQILSECKQWKTGKPLEGVNPLSGGSGGSGSGSTKNPGILGFISNPLVLGILGTIFIFFSKQKR